MSPATVPAFIDPAPSMDLFSGNRSILGADGIVCVGASFVSSQALTAVAEGDYVACKPADPHLLKLAIARLSAQCPVMGYSAADFAQAQRHVSHGENMVRHQQAIVDEGGVGDRDRQTAEAWLVMLQAGLAKHVAKRDKIAEQLATRSP